MPWEIMEINKKIGKLWEKLGYHGSKARSKRRKDTKPPLYQVDFTTRYTIYRENQSTHSFPCIPRKNRKVTIFRSKTRKTAQISFSRIKISSRIGTITFR